MRGVDDLVGRKFGRLFVVEEGERKIDSDGRHRTSVKWICDCGATVTVRATRVRNGKTLSCGCIQKENLAMRNSIHQSCQTRLYRIWCAMKTRCDNPNTSIYKNYGGRGITVCDEWRNSFECFQKWALKSGYDDSKSVDRIDNNGNYTPANCRWATKIEQANNKRSNRMLYHNGVYKTVSEWAKVLNLPVYLIEDRVNKLGWSVEEALTLPIRNRKEVLNGRTVKSGSETCENSSNF